MAMPRVSVLMPMRNMERYVADAARSVLAQEYRDLELVVVDDGSADRSRAIVEGLGDPRVRVVPGVCRGFSAAVNTAFGAARGEILMECDADDLFPPGRVGEQVRLLEVSPQFGAVCGGFSTISPAGDLLARCWDPASAEGDITEELLRGETRTHLCTFAIRRECVDALGGMREFFETGSDIDLQLRLAERCRVAFQPVERYRYRLHDASVTHAQSSARRQFFETYARELRAQRAAGGTDELERGMPRAAPVTGGARDRLADQLAGLLLGEAWRRHRRGEKLASIALGLRALARTPTSAGSWRSVAALVVKRAGE
jgi:glycosyltransferase involved in cell wall biosynthesis